MIGDEHGLGEGGAGISADEVAQHPPVLVVLGGFDQEAPALEPGCSEGCGGYAASLFLEVGATHLGGIDALDAYGLGQRQVEAQVDADNHRVAIDDAQHLVNFVGVQVSGGGKWGDS